MTERETVPQEPRKETILASRTAYIFPGQGVQEVGMGFDLYNRSRAAKDVFDQADEVSGFPLTKFIFEGPKEELARTDRAQPAIMTVSVAAYEAFKESRGGEIPTPLAVSGHSLGFYTAGVIGGSMSFEDGLRLVVERGRLMWEVSKEQEGGMTAIIGKFDLSVIEEICKVTGVDIANLNSDNQIIISGDKNSLARAIERIRGLSGIRTRDLEVSGAWHSRLMLPAQPGFDEAISGVTIKDPQVPISAISKRAFITSAQEVREEGRVTLCGGVNWRDSVRYMEDQGVANFIEFGTGKVLGGLNRQINMNLKTFNVNTMDSIQEFAAAVNF